MGSKNYLTNRKNVRERNQDNKIDQMIMKKNQEEKRAYNVIIYSLGYLIGC